MRAFASNGSLIASAYGTVSAAGTAYVEVTGSFWCFVGGMTYSLESPNHAPVANVGGPYTGAEGAAVTLSWSATDADGDTPTYSWNFGDGTTGSGATLPTSHVYADDGSYTISLTANDGKGGTDTKTASVTISNVAPQVNAGTDQTVAGGATVTIAASFTDPGTNDGPWATLIDWGDHGTTTGSATAPGAVGGTHVYARAGTYDVYVVVTEKGGAGAKGQSAVKVTVGNRAPNANAGGNNADHTAYAGTEGTALGFTGTGSDPDGGSVTYSWDFGDGSPAGAGQSLSHTYANDGVYTATLTVTDNDNATATATATVTIANLPPTATPAVSTNAVNEGSSFTLSLTNVQDVAADLPSVRYAFDCGDGNGFGAYGTASSVSCTASDDGTRQVRLRVTDGKDVSEYPQARQPAIVVAVANVAPSVGAIAGATINEGATYTAPGGFTDPGADTWNATVDYGDGAGAQPLTLSGKAFSLSHPYADNGTYTVTVKVTDDDGGTDSQTATVIVNNVVPSVDAFAGATINEGGTYAPSSGSFADPGSDTWTATVDYGDGAGAQPLVLSGKTFAVSHTYAQNGTYTVTVAVKDDDNATGTKTAAVVVNNVAPTLGAITVPLMPVQVGSAVAASATFTDPGTKDTHTGDVQWDNTAGYPFASATVTESNGSGGVNASSTTLTPGVYTISLRVSDKDGGVVQGTAPTYVVVYDPTGSFVTGGGWILSNAGDCTLNSACQAASGKSTFGFVSKYQKGATVPSGETQFEFTTGGLKFVSTSYAWLTVSGPLAQFKGEGTVNGQTGYQFLLTAVDGDVAGGGGADKFRIKITRTSDGAVVYDNQRGQGDDSSAATALGGGSVVIHK